MRHGSPARTPVSSINGATATHLPASVRTIKTAIFLFSPNAFHQAQNHSCLKKGAFIDDRTRNAFHSFSKAENDASSETSSTFNNFFTPPF